MRDGRARPFEVGVGCRPAGEPVPLERGDDDLCLIHDRPFDRRVRGDAPEVLARRRVLHERMSARREHVRQVEVRAEGRRLRRSSRAPASARRHEQRDEGQHHQDHRPGVDHPVPHDPDPDARVSHEVLHRLRHRARQEPPDGREDLAPDEPAARMRGRLRHTERRVVRDPPDARVEHLHPGVRVRLLHLEVPGQRVPFARSVARHQARRDPERPQHDRERARDLLAEPRAGHEQEMIDGVDPRRGPRARRGRTRCCGGSRIARPPRGRTRWRRRR